MAQDGDYFQSAPWRTPAGVDQHRFELLLDQFRIMGHAFDDLLTRLDRIETKLDGLIEQQSKRRPAKVAKDNNV
jgi:hypothetical protein